MLNIIIPIMLVMLAIAAIICPFIYGFIRRYQLITSFKSFNLNQKIFIIFLIITLLLIESLLFIFLLYQIFSK